MNTPPSSQPRWPALLLAVFALLAITPPSTTIVAAFPWITQHPQLATLLFVIYELLVGISALTTAFLKKSGNGVPIPGLMPALVAWRS